MASEGENRDSVSRLVSTVAIVVALGSIAGFLYVGHLDRLPGPVGPTGSQGPQGQPGSTCAGPSCPINRTYAGFEAIFVLSTNSVTAGTGIVFHGCHGVGYGSFDCNLTFLGLPPPEGFGPGNRSIVGLNYTPTSDFEFVGSDPTLGLVRVEQNTSINFQLWFQVLSQTGTVGGVISLAESESVPK